MPLDARIEAQKLLTTYDTQKETISILLTGESGNGKTYAARNAPFPIHIDSFDPGGTLGLRTEIKKGNIIPDTSFENEDPMHPTVFAAWEQVFRRRVREKYFESFACYWLDSATTWTDSILNAVQGKRGAAGQLPLWGKDYHPQTVLVKNYLRLCMNLPCHFVLTAHLEPYKDAEGNTTSWRPLFSGKGAVKIPLLFDEVWRAERKETQKGFDYFINTQESGFYIARSRIAAEGLLDKREENNISKIFKKAGVKALTKESLFSKVKDEKNG